MFQVDENERKNLVNNLSDAIKEVNKQKKIIFMK